MTYVVAEPCIKCKYGDCVPGVRWTLFTRGRISW